MFEAQEVQIASPQPAAASDEEKGTATKTSPPVIEIQDSTAECEEARSDLLQMEEKSFVSNLHSFMKNRGSPIERIPHLGFKQINLWMIYKAVEKLGGYDSVTVRRLWKKVYNELGGSPGSTSAATCTRRHYERLVLPFERHLKGEEDKPLPASKPRKPYKRNPGGKIKAEGAEKRFQSDKEMESKRSPEAAHQSETELQVHSTLWPPTSDRLHPECSQTHQVTTDLCTSVYRRAQILQVPAMSPWTPPIPSAAGEVISPLEKKKRMAQASLKLPLSMQGEDKERPSVIHCSQSPAWASSHRSSNSSDGSPHPLSSSSSRSPSPYSISSEEGEAKPATSSELTSNCPSAAKITSSRSEDTSPSCSQSANDLAGEKRDASHVLLKDQTKDPACNLINKYGVKNFHHPFPSSFTVKSDWAPTSASSFTKVIPKSGQLPRPAPVRPGYKFQQSRLMHQNGSLACAKKIKMMPLLYQTEKRDKFRTMLQKVPPTQQNISHSTTATLPVSCILSYDKSGRDSYHQSQLHHAFFPNRMKIAQSQLMYHHVPVSPSHSALIGPAVCPLPYSIPLLSPQIGYALPNMNPIYPNKL
ncbi:AT-rich interactive domain-containing protein 5A [Aulostomus maculatus]